MALLFLLTFLGTFFQPGAIAATITGIDFSALPGNRIEARIRLDAPMTGTPLHFTIDNPARIALDFPDTTLALSQKSVRIGIGKAETINVVEAGGRSRVVLNLTGLVPYEVTTDEDVVRVTLEAVESDIDADLGEIDESVAALMSDVRIENIDFRRGAAGQGLVSVRLSDPNVGVRIEEVGGEVIVDFAGVSLPEALDRQLDVIDFATPARSIDTFAYGNGTRMVIASTGVFEQMAYQTGNEFTVELKPLTEREREAIEKEKFGYTGERLSLNFQDIEVRAVLQLIADFTGLNLVASDSVNGNVTLRLKNVPWDQALDIILKSKGLGMRQAGNVLMVAPQEEIAQRERLELEASEELRQLAPLTTEFIQIDYAKASDIATLIKSDARNLLTERGNVSVDQRTNTLLVQETADVITQIRALVERLDIPVRQVLIDTRIVVANDEFTRSIGVNLDYQDGQQTDLGRGQAGGNTAATPTAPTAPTSQINTNVSGANASASARSALPTALNPSVDGYIRDLTLTSAGGAASLGLFIGRVGSWLLNLEIQAAQAEKRVEVISQPQVVTADQQKARIASGEQIPYQQASSSGATNVQFKNAELSLEVTPQITPDDRVIMDLLINNDSRGTAVVGGVAINTQEIETRVLVDNGETIVLGGIFQTIDTSDRKKVPLLGDIPYFGSLFRDETSELKKNELLIFITPRIIKDTLKSGL